VSCVVWTKYGPYCAACGEPLTQEEVDFDDCDACGGEGFPEDRDEFFDHDVSAQAPAGPPRHKDQS
jgi:hypothetical protein